MSDDETQAIANYMDKNGINDSYRGLISCLDELQIMDFIKTVINIINSEVDNAGMRYLKMVYLLTDNKRLGNKEISIELTTTAILINF